MTLYMTWCKHPPFVSVHPYSAAGTQLRYKCRDNHTHAQSLLDTYTHTLTPRLRLRRQCILGLEVMKSLRRWERGSLCCLGDWGSLGTAEGEGGDEAGGAGGGWWGDVNRDISYQWEREPWRRGGGKTWKKKKKKKKGARIQRKKRKEEEEEGTQNEINKPPTNIKKWTHNKKPKQNLKDNQRNVKPSLSVVM